MNIKKQKETRVWIDSTHAKVRIWSRKRTKMLTSSSRLGSFVVKLELEYSCQNTNLGLQTNQDAHEQLEI